MNSPLAFLCSLLLFADVPVAEMPRVTHFHAPNYPEMAWQARVHGKVVMKILIHKDGRFAFTDTITGPPALVSAAKENLCSWTFAAVESDEPIPLTVEYEYLISRSTSSQQLTTEVSYDLPNHVTISAPEYEPSCMCTKKRSKWKFWGR